MLEVLMRASVVATLIVSGAFVLGLTVEARQAGQAPKEHTMTGCLVKGNSENTFVVNNTAEKGPKTIGIVESKAKLAPHVGHKIDITGTAVPNKEAESANPKPPMAAHYMRITAVKMVSATCP
jgi:hypothetical protein